MKGLKYIVSIMAGALLLNSCKDDDPASGNPVMNVKTEFSTAMFGDSLAFSVNASDADVPLSTLKAQLFYGEEKVSETVIRTKTTGDYTGKMYVPYYANIPNGRATLKLLLQNINFTLTEKEYVLPLTRPDFPYLTFVTAEKEYRMERTSLYQYAVTDEFPQKIKGYIKAPQTGTQGNEIVFGRENGEITQGNMNDITFSNTTAGTYSVTFNTHTYEAAPFINLSFDNTDMVMIDDNTYKIEKEFTRGAQMEVTGIADYDDWWIDPDYFTRDEEGKLTFLPVSGKYRVTANFVLKYFIIEAMDGNALASLKADGTGAVWVIGEKIGKPSLANEVGWTTGKALCMAPIAKGVYQMTVVGGKTIGTSSINFKFFHQKDWGGEFTQAAITSTSDIVLIPNADGNLSLAEGKSLVTDKVYVFTLDLSKGNDKAVLSVTEK